MQEFYVTATRKGPAPLSIDTAIQALRNLSHWNVHRPTVDDLIDAARLQKQYQLSYWDALIVQSAIQMNCTVIWSEDFNTGQSYQNVIVRSPFG
jgi:predicted nucleic acid-binding protein